MYIETLYNKRNSCYIYMEVVVLVVDKIKMVYTTLKFLISAEKSKKQFQPRSEVYST